jgi:hypothetical protein
MKTRVRLVLDTTAVHRYPSLSVGELIAMLNDDGARFGVSVVTLASASALLGDDAMLNVLIANEAFNGLELLSDDWRPVGSTMRAVNDIAAAHAAQFAIDNECLIATTCPELYADLEDPPLLVIEN